MTTKSDIHLGSADILAALFAIFCLVSSAFGQLTICSQVEDLNAGAVGSFPTNLTFCAGPLYFSAYTLSTGWEPWKYSGAGITLVSNINDTADDIGGGILEGNDSSPSGFITFSNAVYFSAYDPRRGAELWRYNGTNAMRITDINPDASDTIKSNPASAWPSELTVLGNALYFSADGGGVRPNYELWKYDGVTASQVANIHPNIGSNFSSFPRGLVAFAGRLYFMADDGADGYELWTSTGSGASMLANINPSGDSYPKQFTPYNNKLYFQAFTDTLGYELWQTDGTNTSLVANLNPDSGSSFPELLTVFNNALYFRADDGTNGAEMWRYDGKVLDLVSNINPTGSSSPKNFTVFQGQLCFAADDGVHGWEPWRSDGTSASLVTNLNSFGDSFPEHLTAFGGALYFVATTTDTGYELWRFDGTNAPTLVADINPGPGSSYPQSLVALPDRLCFCATEDGVSNWELWSLQVTPSRITAINQLGNDIQLTWVTTGGVTNVVQSSDNGASGPFTDLSEALIILGTGETTTNFTDIGAPNVPTERFYRIKQL